MHEFNMDTNDDQNDECALCGDQKYRGEIFDFALRLALEIASSRPANRADGIRIGRSSEVKPLITLSMGIRKMSDHCHCDFFFILATRAN